MSTNIVWHQHAISKDERQQLNRHKSFILWFTGLSGSGKSTLANALDKSLYDRGIRSFVLDGDNIRHGLCKDLGFSDADRCENIRRISEVSKLFTEAGTIVMTAFISPFKADREIARSLVGPEEFLEVYVKCALNVCEERDTKGLYQKARRGEIKSFTGIDSPYEEPDAPELVIETDHCTVDEAVKQIIEYMTERGLIQ